MRIVVPGGANWLTKLAESIRSANEGDVLVVPNDTKKELAENAATRMNKAITIEVGSE